MAVPDPKLLTVVDVATVIPVNDEDVLMDVAVPPEN